MPAKKTIFVTLGVLCLALGFIGAFLPILPTSPFVLLAAFCFAKGSPRLHQKLLDSKIFGSLLVSWEQHGAISLQAKILALLFMLALMGYSVVYISMHIGFKILIVLTFIAVQVFIWSRPSNPD